MVVVVFVVFVVVMVVVVVVVVVVMVRVVVDVGGRTCPRSMPAPEECGKEGREGMLDAVSAMDDGVHEGCRVLDAVARPPSRGWRWSAAKAWLRCGESERL